MVTVTSAEYFSHFLASLEKSVAARQLWTANERWLNPAWTSAMTSVLVQATKNALAASPSPYCVCAKGEPPDKYGHNEYFTLDVTAYDDNSWGPPALLVEHENSPFKEKVQYCAWKLLCVDAAIRVLVVYIDSAGRYSSDFSRRSDVTVALAKVAAAHPLRPPLWVIIGDWSVPIGVNGWADVYQLALVPDSDACLLRSSFDGPQ